MKKNMSKRSKGKRTAVIVLAGLLILLFGGFYVYTLDYYRADEQAVAVFSPEDSVTVRDMGDLIVLQPALAAESDSGIIFYPGGKVEAIAYLPLLRALARAGETCVLVKMPFNLAVFDVNAADEVYAALPEVQTWYLAGHSLGGAMASTYAGSHPNELAGLILLGAWPVNDASLPTIAIYGSEDQGIDLSKLEGTDDRLEIAGGNHAYFGNYGEQEGDGVASITRQEQQDQAVAAIVAFIESN